jgi:hypothetical protein
MTTAKYLLSNQYRAALEKGADHEPVEFSELRFYELFKEAALREDNPDSRARQVLRAYALMKWHHLDTKLRRNNDLYYTHPLAVANQLLEKKAHLIHSWEDIVEHIDLTSLVSRLLHDTMEDSGLTIKDLEFYKLDQRSRNRVEDLTRFENTDEKGVVIAKEHFGHMIERIGTREADTLEDKIEDMGHNRTSNLALPKDQLTYDDWLKHDFYAISIEYLEAIKAKEIFPWTTMRDYVAWRGYALADLSVPRVEEAMNRYCPEDPPVIEKTMMTEAPAA